MSERKDSKSENSKRRSRDRLWKPEGKEIEKENKKKKKISMEAERRTSRGTRRTKIGR